MYWNVWSGLVVILTFLSVYIEEARAQGVNLGALEWCETLCLCHKDTHENMHCFEDLEIYELLGVDKRKVQRLSRANFKLEEKLMWCSETCICHKAGRKEFKCTDRVILGEFINEKAPFLSPYLEPEVEVFDVRDIVDREDEALPPPPPSPFPVEGNEEEEEEMHEEKKDRHDRKKNRKHRKNKKKNHHDRKEVAGSGDEEIVIPVTTTSTAPSTKAAVTEPEERRVFKAQIFPQASTDRDMPSRPPEAERESPVLEVPRERKTVAGEVSIELLELRNNVDQIKEDVALNQHILLVTVAVAAIAMIGVLILAIYSCCIRRSSKNVSKGQRNTPLHQEGNSVTKVALDEAW